MSEPISTTTTITAVATTAAAAPLLGVDPLVAVGAVTGAGIFILNEQGHSKLKAVLLFFIATVCGCMGANLAASIVSSIMPPTVDVSVGIGAIIASAVSIKLLQNLLAFSEHQAWQNLLKGRPK